MQPTEKFNLRKNKMQRPQQTRARSIVKLLIQIHNLMYFFNYFFRIIKSICRLFSRSAISIFILCYIREYACYLPSNKLISMISHYTFFILHQILYEWICDCSANGEFEVVFWHCFTHTLTYNSAYDPFALEHLYEANTKIQWFPYKFITIHV